MILHPLHHRALRARGHAAGARPRASHKAGATRDGFELSGPMFVVTGTTEEEMAAAATAHASSRSRSTGPRPAYRGVLELHGWGEVGDELNAMSKRGRVGGDGRADHRRDARHVRGGRRARRGRGPDSAPASAVCSTGSASTCRTALDPDATKAMIASLKRCRDSLMDRRHRLSVIRNDRQGVLRSIQASSAGPLSKLAISA